MSVQNSRQPFPEILKWTYKPGEYRGRQTDLKFELHSHQFNEIAIVTKGSSSVISYNYSEKVLAPFAVIYPAGILHMQVNSLDDNYERYLIRCSKEMFSDSAMEENVSQTLASFKRVTLIKLDDGEVRRLKELCEASIEFGNNAYPAKMIMLAVLWQISEAWKRNYGLLSSEKSLHTSTAYLGELVDYLFEHCGEKLLLEDIASTFYISKTKLARDFRNVFRMSVNEYISELRIGLSEEMLLNGKSITETAERCGFGTASYFVKCFKKASGKTPMQFVKNPHDVRRISGNRFFGNMKNNFVPSDEMLNEVITKNDPQILFKGKQK